MSTMGEFSVPTARARLKRSWGWELLRGCAAVLFGLMCFAWPLASLWALVLIWGIYALIDGVAAIVWGSSAKWWPMVALGILSVIAGLVAFAWPGITAVAILYVIAFWAILRGCIEIVAAVWLRKVIAHEWLLGLAGVATILLGVAMVAFPGVGLLSMVWLIGVFAVVFGAVTIALSVRVRGMLDIGGAPPAMQT